MAQIFSISTSNTEEQMYECDLLLENTGGILIDEKTVEIQVIEPVEEETDDPDEPIEEEVDDPDKVNPEPVVQVQQQELCEFLCKLKWIVLGLLTVVLIAGIVFLYVKWYGAASILKCLCCCGSVPCKLVGKEKQAIQTHDAKVSTEDPRLTREGSAKKGQILQKSQKEASPQSMIKFPAV